MFRLFVVLAVTATAADLAVATTAGATPLAKVVQLLNDLKQQVSAQGATEATLFNEFNAWCDSEIYSSKSQIGDGKSKMADLAAYIEEQNAQQEKLKSEIDEAVAEITSNEVDLNGAKDIRTKEHSNYMAAESQYVASIDELIRAIEVLQNPNPSFIEASKSVQKALERAMTVTPQQQASIKDFFQQTAETAQQATPTAKPAFLQQAAPYQSKTGELIQTLQQIKDETAKNRDSSSKEESSALHAFELLQQSLEQEIKNGNNLMASKKMQVSKSQEAVAASQGDYQTTDHVVTQSLKYLEDCERTCEQKTLEWKTRTKLRSDEITAITEAVEILSSEKGQAAQDLELRQRQAVDDTTKYFTPSFVQLSHKLRNTITVTGISFLETKVRMNQRLLTGQQILAEARAAAAAGQPDPFKNVRKMINEMIQRLLSEAAEEAEHKGWCDTEMGKSELQKTQKEKEVRQLKSKLEEETAQIAQLDDEIKQLIKNLAEAESMQLEAQKVREGENSQALIATKEYEDAQSLIQNAVTVLQEFYAQKQGGSSLMQTSGSEDPPETFSGEYESKDASGVLGILEISMADFARLETETKTAEAQAQNEFQKLTQENAVRKATLQKDLEYKEIEKQKLEGSVQRIGADLQGFNAELSAVTQYIEKLKPSCTNTADSHEVRKERREAEIKSLQDALAILNNEGIA